MMSSAGVSGSSSSASVPESSAEDAGPLGSRNQVIHTYIENAKHKRSIITRQLSAAAKKKATDELDDQLMLPIGKMYYCQRRGRGVAIRGEAVRNMIFRRSTTYKRMLEKCMEVYPEDKRSNAEFYVADSRGNPIWSSDTIVIDLDDGPQEMPWTLGSHIRLSNVKYPSKAKYYCVRKELEDEEEMPKKDTPPVLKNSEDTPPRSPDQNSYDQMYPKKLKDNHFEPTFTVSKKTHYRKECSFRTNLYQKRVLQLTDVNNENEPAAQEMILEENPCCMTGVFFTGIDIFDKNSGGDIDLVECNNPAECVVEYKTSNDGNNFGIWTGGLAYPNEGVALLAAVVTGGFHPFSEYIWSFDGLRLREEKFPILYATERGEYVCEICTHNGDIQLDHKMSFIVQGTNMEWTVEVPPPIGSSSMLTLKQATFPDDRSCMPMETSSEETPTIKSDAVISRLLQELLSLSLEDPMKLRLLEVVGEGAFGIVHKACWRGCVVAAKVVPWPIETSICSKEMENLKLVQHPNLSALLGMVPMGHSKMAIITQLVRGVSLNEHIFGEARKLSMTEKLLVCVQISQAVLFLHTNSPPMAHLDIKPANILIDGITLHVVLTDFGLSKVMTETSVKAGTRTMLAGTPGFQSPEQLQASSIGVECDVYALGAVMVVMFGEKPLWPSLTPFQIMHKVTIEKEMPSVAGIEPRIGEVCSKCFLTIERRPIIQVVLHGLIKIMESL